MSQLFNIMTRVYNEAENIWMNGIKHLLKQLKSNVVEEG